MAASWRGHALGSILLGPLPPVLAARGLRGGGRWPPRGRAGGPGGSGRAPPGTTPPAAGAPA
eukprot:6462938-Pyramimonas_sp.AAC.1